MLSSLSISNTYPHLLSIDLGLRFGWSCFDQKTRLIAYGSHHCGQANKLGNIAYSVMKVLPSNSVVLVEGNSELYKHWQRNAQKFQIPIIQVYAEGWRHDCLSQKEQVDGKRAKEAAIRIAKTLIKSQSGQGSHSLRHDAAEACLMGWWGLKQLQWISEAQFKQGLKA